jgi:hypothetical protein
VTTAARINRYELKYVIDVRRYQALHDELLNFMQYDRHADANGFYRLRGLYYDSPDFACYRAKVDGLRHRRKLRLRVYLPNADAPCPSVAHVEIKEREDRTVRKRRVILPLDQARALCAGEAPPGPLDPLDAAAAGEVQYLVRALHLRPAAIVAYRRQAFVSNKNDPGVRLTFDSDLTGRTWALDVAAQAKDRLFLPPGRLIMELKVNDRVPDWMTAILARHDCVVQRVSKYCVVLAGNMARLRLALRHKEYPYGYSAT